MMRLKKDHSLVMLGELTHGRKVIRCAHAPFRRPDYSSTSY